MTRRHDADVDRRRSRLIEALERNRARASDEGLRVRLGDAIGRLRLTPRQLAGIAERVAGRYGE